MSFSLMVTCSYCKSIPRLLASQNVLGSVCFSRSNTTLTISDEGDNFRVLDLKKAKSAQTTRRRQQVQTTFPPRASKMSDDQDWTNVWPGQRTFHPATVPLPIRQGINKLGASPAKYGNAELMKIPNFLHLTPPAVKKHCEALKKFCTPWPVGLRTDEDCGRHFPLEVITSDYCHSSPTIRDPLSRIITLKVPLNRLNLDSHAKDKFLRLVGDRYDEKTGMVTIVTDKCPLKQQNYDYALYLLTALFHESWITEPWELEKSETDMEYYDWDRSRSKCNVEDFLKCSKSELNVSTKEVTNYKDAVISLFDEGENEQSLSKYKAAASKLLVGTDASVIT